MVENIRKLKRMTRSKATRVHKTKSQMSVFVEKISHVNRCKIGIETATQNFLNLFWFQIQSKHTHILHLWRTKLMIRGELSREVCAVHLHIFQRVASWCLRNFIKSNIETRIQHSGCALHIFGYSPNCKALVNRFCKADKDFFCKVPSWAGNM